jgi:uncharacterized protein YndB with AHSA1/START domain
MQTIDIRRTYAAPRQRVFDAWTRPEQMKQWYGPRGFTTPVAKVDLRKGGMVHFCMRAADGQEFWCKGVYEEVTAPERFVASDSFSDADGNTVPASKYGMSADWPDEARLAVSFEEKDGITVVTLRHELGAAPAHERDMCAAGWGEQLDKLSEYLAKETRS